MVVEFELELPTVLEDLPRLVDRAGEAAMLETMIETSSAIAEGERIPKNRGHLAQRLYGWVETRFGGVRSGEIVGAVRVRGSSIAYGIVQEAGRRAGAAGPSTGHLFWSPGSEGQPDGWKGGWVNRRLRAAVVTRANVTLGKLKRKRHSKEQRERHERRAALDIARFVARKIHRQGMPGKAFAAFETKNVAPRFRRAFFAYLHAWKPSVFRNGGGS